MPQFNEIPANLREPIIITEIDQSGAVDATIVRRNLLIGQSSQTFNSVERVFNGSQLEIYGNSPLKEMLDIFFRNNPTQEVYAVGLEVGSGGSNDQATGTIAITGTATASASMQLYIGDVRVPFSIANEDTADEAATKIVTAITNSTNDHLVSAAASSGTVTITAKLNGTHGNDILLALSYLDSEVDTVAGLIFTLTPMSGGIGSASYMAVPALLNDIQYHIVALQDSTTAQITPIREEFEQRFQAQRQNDGLIFIGAREILTNLTTLGDSFNSQILSIIGNNNSLSSPWKWGAGYGATVGFSLSNDPAQSLHLLEIKGLLAPSPENLFDYTERNGLLFSGISTFRTIQSSVFISSSITTYQTNPQGLQTTAYLNVETVATLLALRADWNNTILQKYPRAKVADDGFTLPPGQLYLTPNTIRTELAQKANEWQSIRGWIENVEEFLESIIVVRAQDNPNRFNLVIRPDLVNQFKILATRIAFIL